MPTLNQLKCTIERDPKNISLNEYNTRYGNGYVETFVPVPDPEEGLPGTFSVHLTSSGYIAPGLAMFVYVDGVAQCNRNRRGLKMPSNDVDPWEYEIDFRVRQKETKLGDGKFVVHLWSWAELNTTSDDTASKLNKEVLNSIGTIEVVILRCEFLPEWGYVTPSKPVTKLGQRGWDPKKKREQTRLNGSQDCWDAGSEVDSVAFGMFDGAYDANKKTAAKVPRIFSLDGGNDFNDFESLAAPTYPYSEGDDPRRFERPPGSQFAMPYHTGGPWAQPPWMPGYNPYAAYATPSIAAPWYHPPHAYHPTSPWKTGSGTYKRGKVTGPDWQTHAKEKMNWDEPTTAGAKETKADDSNPADKTWGATDGNIPVSGDWDNPTGDAVEEDTDTPEWDAPVSTQEDANPDTTETPVATGGDAADDSGNIWAKSRGTWADEVKSRSKDKAGEKSKSTPNRSRKSANDRADKKKTNDPERPHVKSYWVSETPKPSTKSMYIAPAPSLPQVPIKLAEEKGLTHQVQPGKGWIWEHRRCKPKYIDSLRKPYAVFAFKYRSAEALEKLLGVEVKRSKEDYRTRMNRLTKEEIIEELMRAKNRAGYHTDSSVDSESRASSSGGTSANVVSKPKSVKQVGGWDKATNKKTAPVVKPAVRAGGHVDPPAPAAGW